MRNLFFHCERFSIDAKKNIGVDQSGRKGIKRRADCYSAGDIAEWRQAVDGDSALMTTLLCKGSRDTTGGDSERRVNIQRMDGLKRVRDVELH